LFCRFCQFVFNYKAFLSQLAMDSGSGYGRRATNRVKGHGGRGEGRSVDSSLTHGRSGSGANGDESA
jgi:hypothetical protein